MSIVLLMTDTTRYDMLGCVNSTISTPNLDRLAAGGVRFDSAYSTQPVCGPARAAIFTGLFPHSSGAWGNSIPLGDNVKTIGQRMRDNGIRAGYIGKWHLDGSDYFGMGRCPDGWDPEYWYDMRNYLEELTPEERAKSRLIETSFAGISADFTFGHRCADRAVRFLEQHGGEDFLLCVSFDEPHGPCLCPEPYASMYKGYQMPDSPAYHDTLEGKPRYQSYWRDAYAGKKATDLGLYFGAQSFIDSEIGRVLAAVEKHAPGSMVIYTSDHGAARGAHGLQTKGPSVYDEIAKVPFLVNWPDRVKANSVGGLASHIDICPTILDHFGLPVPKSLQGRSMIPELANPSQPTNKTDKVFVTFNRFEIDLDGFGGLHPMRAVITDRFKLAIHLLESTDELYDRENDPYDMHNLIGDPAYANVRAELHDAILACMADTRDPFRGYQWANRPWRSARAPSWHDGNRSRNRETEDAYEPRQLDYEDGLPLRKNVR